MLKRYHIRELLEWKALIPMGNARVRVEFKGGQMGSSGMLPAEFATANAALQRIIESSEYFRSGRITCYPPETEGKSVRKVKPKVAKAANVKAAEEKPAVVEPVKTEDDESESRGPDPGDDGQDGGDPNEYDQC